METNLYTPAGALDAPEKVKNNLVVEGVLEDISEEIASNGSTYVRGLITNKSEALSFKAWDTALANVEGLIGKVVQITGKLQMYNEHLDLICSGKGDKVSITDTGKDIAGYIYSAPVSPEKLTKGLIKKVSDFKDETCKIIALTALNSCKKLLGYFPLSPDCHREKGGLIYHIYLCICQACNQPGLPVIDGETFSFNEEVVQTALICSKLGVFGWYKPDIVTGKITEVNEDRKALFGHYDHLITFDKVVSLAKSLYKVEDTDTKDAEEKPKELDENIISQITHAIICINDKSKVPATKEALIARNIVLDELAKFAYDEALRSMEKGEVAKISLYGTSRKIVAI